jgi:hypothetical protein
MFSLIKLEANSVGLSVGESPPLGSFPFTHQIFPKGLPGSPFVLGLYCPKSRLRPAIVSAQLRSQTQIVSGSPKLGGDRRTEAQGTTVEREHKTQFTCLQLPLSHRGSFLRQTTLLDTQSSPGPCHWGGASSHQRGPLSYVLWEASL